MEQNVLYDSGQVAYNEGRYEDAVSLFSEAAGLGHADAKAFLALALYMYACQIQNESIHYQNGEALVHGQQQASAMSYEVVKIAMDYLVHNHVDDATCNLMGQLITQSFGLIYFIAASGNGIGYRIIEDGYNFDIDVIGRTIFMEYSHFHEEYVSLFGTKLSDYSVFGMDEKDKRIAEACKATLRNAKDVAKILGLLGREYDALMLRTRMALEMSDYSNGNRAYLLAAEWFYHEAHAQAREALVSGTDDSSYQNWREDNAQTTEKFNKMTANYRKVILGYKKEGKKPALSAFYREDDVVPAVEDNSLYVNLEKGDIKEADNYSGEIAKERVLSVIAQINYKRFVPMILFASVVGFFMGGLIPIYTSGGAFAKGFGTVWFIITMILTWIRSLTVSDGIASGKSFTTFRRIMIIGTAILCLHSVLFILGIIAFSVLKAMARKYE